MQHVQQTFHIQGSVEELDPIAERMLGVRLNQMNEP